MIYATTRLVALKGDQIVGTGTGFYYRVSVEVNRVAAFVVTNKHVIAGADAIGFSVHLGRSDSEGNIRPAGTFEQCKIGFKGGVWEHPDPAVDLAAIPIGGLMEAMISGGLQPHVLTMTKDNLPGPSDWDDFAAIETVKMVGCPNGLFDEDHALPLVRQGITASQLSVLYQGRPEFVVDMACFPGSSGSPIFVLDEFGRIDKKTGSMMLGSNRFLLVGVLHAGPLINSDGTVSFGRTASFSVSSMMHLGYAVRSTELLALDAMVIKSNEPRS